MSPRAAVIVCDAHLGFAENRVEQAFHRFLAAVPGIGDELFINGDLFEFWFEYRSVIPEAAFPTLERVAELVRRGVRVSITGGNHDRFGGRFWRERVGATFYPEGAECNVAGWRAHVAHGDGIGDEQLSSRLLHAVTRMAVSRWAFGLIHPDLGLGLVRRLSPRLAGKLQNDALKDRVAARQEAYARAELERRPELELLVLGHTHRPALVQVDRARWYLNPGPWMEGYHFAVVTSAGPRLERFE